MRGAITTQACLEQGILSSLKDKVQVYCHLLFHALRAGWSSTTTLSFLLSNFLESSGSLYSPWWGRSPAPAGLGGSLYLSPGKPPPSCPSLDPPWSVACSLQACSPEMQHEIKQQAGKLRNITSPPPRTGQNLKLQVAGVSLKLGQNQKSFWIRSN